MWIWLLRCPYGAGVDGSTIRAEISRTSGYSDGRTGDLNSRPFSNNPSNDTSAVTDATAKLRDQGDQRRDSRPNSLHRPQHPPIHAVRDVHYPIRPNRDAVRLSQ